MAKSKRMTEIGLFLTKARKGRGLSQSELARSTKLARHTIRNIESGAHAGLFENVEKIAYALGVKVPGAK